MELNHFKIAEFQSPDLKGSGDRMDQNLLLILDSIRSELGRPMIVNSGFRTTEHNEKVGGSPNSSHLKGLAVDIHCPDSAYRFHLVRLAMTHGISRIGIYKTFIHLDIDGSKAQGVMWNL